MATLVRWRRPSRAQGKADVARKRDDAADPTLAARPPPAPGEGEVDYRWSLANERTFLAWIRTSLSLIAAAVAVAQLIPPFPRTDLRWALGAFLAILAAGTASLAYTRWAATEKAMREREARPAGRSLLLLTAALIVLAVVVFVLVLVTR